MSEFVSISKTKKCQNLSRLVKQKMSEFASISKTKIYQNLSRLVKNIKKIQILIFFTNFFRVVK